MTHDEIEKIVHPSLVFELSALEFDCIERAFVDRIIYLRGISDTANQGSELSKEVSRMLVRTTNLRARFLTATEGFLITEPEDEI